MKSNRILQISLFFIYMLILCEGGARLIFSAQNPHKGISIECNELWRNNWERRHNSQIQIYYKFDNYSPTRGWSLKPNLRNEVIFGDKILNSNSKGIRGQTEYTYVKPKGKTRILVLGDSFTFGDGVSDTATYPYFLQQLSPNAEVINFGIHGYGHDQMLICLKEEGVKYNPDIVILGFVAGDMVRNMLEFRDYAKPRFVPIHNKLKLKNSPVCPPETMLKREPYRLKLIDLLGILYNKIAQRLGVRNSEARRITTAILDEMVEVITDSNAKPIFVYLSIGNEMINRQEKLTIPEEYLFKYCKSRGINCIFTRPYFINCLKRGVTLKTLGHWGEQEHLLVGQAINQYLVDNKLSPGKL